MFGPRTHRLSRCKIAQYFLVPKGFVRVRERACFRQFDHRECLFTSTFISGKQCKFFIHLNIVIPQSVKIP